MQEISAERAAVPFEWTPSGRAPKPAGVAAQADTPWLDAGIKELEEAWATASMDKALEVAGRD